MSEPQSLYFDPSGQAHATSELVRLVGERADKFAIADQMLHTMLVVAVVIPDLTRLDQFGPFTSTKGGVTSAVAFATDKEAFEIREITPHMVTLTGKDLIARLPDGLGLLLFTAAGNIDFKPVLLSAMRRDWRERAVRAADAPTPTSARGPRAGLFKSRNPTRGDAR